MEHSYLFVLGILVIVFGARLFRDHLRMQHTQPRENPQYQAHIDALERRVQTLERIVTDQGYDLKRKFDAL